MLLPYLSTSFPPPFSTPRLTIDTMRQSAAAVPLAAAAFLREMCSKKNNPSEKCAGHQYRRWQFHIVKEAGGRGSIVREYDALLCPRRRLHDG
mmetsp:Transcript_37675/g.90827  ORF Transcript_37675/g.90827 Transcript_37675/m.90827 type:complete len:93 (-) Transcript_37675:502-780(-)